MKKYLVLLSLSLLWCLPAYAQVAQPIVPGYQATTGCSGANIPCWAPAATPVNSAALESSHVFKATTGTLFGLSVTATSAAGYVLIYNSTTAPADGAVTPVACYYIPSAPGTVGIAFTPFPLKMSTGIVAVFSTTGCFTQTGSATAFFLGEIF